VTRLNSIAEEYQEAPSKELEEQLETLVQDDGNAKLREVLVIDALLKAAKAGEPEGLQQLVADASARVASRRAAIEIAEEAVEQANLNVGKANSAWEEERGWRVRIVEKGRANGKRFGTTLDRKSFYESVRLLDACEVSSKVRLVMNQAAAERSAASGTLEMAATALNKEQDSSRDIVRTEVGDVVKKACNLVSNIEERRRVKMLEERDAVEAEQTRAKEVQRQKEEAESIKREKNRQRVAAQKHNEELATFVSEIG